MHQPKITQLDFQYLLDSTVCFSPHVQENKTKQRQYKENQPLKKLLNENVPWKPLENNSHEMKVLVVTSNQRARQCQARDSSDQCLCSHF